MAEPILTIHLLLKSQKHHQVSQGNEGKLVQLKSSGLANRLKMIRWPPVQSEHPAAACWLGMIHQADTSEDTLIALHALQTFTRLESRPTCSNTIAQIFSGRSGGSTLGKNCHYGLVGNESATSTKSRSVSHSVNHRRWLGFRWSLIRNFQVEIFEYHKVSECPRCSFRNSNAVQFAMRNPLNSATFSKTSA